jgi:hypothetical protein
MSRLLSGTKKVAELYLIIVGGAYTLAALVALIANAASAGREETGENWIMLTVSGPILTAGIGIRMYRWWGLVLAGIMGILVTEYFVTQSSIDPWEYHNFTIALPMAAILVWVMLPPTWREFKRRSLEAS